jgi:hypothetical protein
LRKEGEARAGASAKGVAFWKAAPSPWQIPVVFLGKERQKKDKWRKKVSQCEIL